MTHLTNLEERMRIKGITAILLAATVSLAAQAEGLGDLSAETVNLIKERQRAVPFEKVQPYLRYCYPPMNDPVFEGVSQKVPSVLGNQGLAELGILDVTAAPFNADPSGTKDSTKALQDAVNFARDHQMVCFLPMGTYAISDTIECIQNLYVRDNGKIAGAQQYPCVLMGSRKAPGKRPLIRLLPNSPGFDDAESRKCAVLFWSRNFGTECRGGPFSDGPEIPQSNIGFNQVFMGIDIQIGEGNPAAIGISMQAAEGSTIQDVSIDARNGHTGMRGTAGSGGSHHNLTVVGGRIGIDIRGFPPQYTDEWPGSQPAPTMSHVTLVNQAERALISRTTGPLAAVGWKIVSQGHGPMVSVEGRQGACSGSACFIDSEFIFETPASENLVFEARRGVFLENVYVRNATAIVETLAANNEGWTHIPRLAWPCKIGLINVLEKGQVEMTEYPYVNGVRMDGPYLEPLASAAPPGDLRSRHIWADDFPSWESPEAVNVKAPPYNAKGDSFADDTAAIQKAIDEHDVVFLPKGYYRLTDTLRLKPRTQLLGLIHPFSVLMQRGSWGKLAAEKPMPLIASPDDADAKTAIAFLGLKIASSYDPRLNPPAAGLYGLEWRAGRHSMVRQVAAMFSGSEPSSLTEDRDAMTSKIGFQFPWAHVSGHGGGRWYNFHVMERLHAWLPGYRHLLVDGTSEPLSIYHLHGQHVYEYGCEIRNARNVSIYGCKQECTAKASFMKIVGCRDIRVFGLGGWAMPRPGTSNFLIEGSRDFLIAGYAPFHRYVEPTVFKEDPWLNFPGGTTNIKDFFPIIEHPREGDEVKVGPFDAPLLYLRGNPRMGGRGLFGWDWLIF
jgi:hypothetical protein